MLIRKSLYYCFAFLCMSQFNLSCTVSGEKLIQSQTTELRAPAYPLITIDPYTCAWSETDNLYDSPVRHWTGKTHSLIGALRVDGQTYRFLGKEDIPLKTLLPMANEGAWNAQYSLTKPVSGWEQLEFDAKKWETAKAAFGTPGMQFVGTDWKTPEIWVRREFSLPELKNGAKLYLVYSHDDDFELYLNGTQIVNTGNSARADVVTTLDASLLSKDGNNIIAAHCLDRGGLAYVDFGIYTESDRAEVFSQTAVQKSVALSATKTEYQFACGPVDLTLQFVSPLLTDDLSLLSRPVNYLNYQVNSTDGAKHDVQIYIEMTPEWAVNEVSQEVEVSLGETGAVGFVKAGTTEQPVLQKKGDNVRIDWGYAYLAANKAENTTIAMGDYFGCKTVFAESGTAEAGPAEMKARMTETMPAMVCVEKLRPVGQEATSGYVMIAYDDKESIQYFGNNLKAWWTENGTKTINDMLQTASIDYGQVLARCAQFDNELWDETLAAGGKNYADLCVLAYRQSIAAHKLVKDNEGNILFLSKENFSNGSIGTVDITYPSAPMYLHYNPDLLKGMMNPILYYSESGKWEKPFAAHDVGTYPLANGQTYGGDMPVEESGNMVILAAAIAQVEGNADYAAKHWEVLTTWTDYLVENGLDPENQLCTDDFAGHFAHNVNLSVKAIMGVASYGKMAKMLGKNDIAEQYTAKAKEMATKWVEMAKDGDHYRLTFDKPDTWSQKYNLVWDKVLELGIFPAEVAQTELAYYLTKQNKYGLPLDNRRTYTKSDWIVWTATLANDLETFQKFIDPVHRYVTETPTRVPMSDWYETPDAKQVGFQARSVVGGYFIKLLDPNLK
ncbi:MAG: glutaminase domain-containing protein [Mangrovibacterium sp.]